MSDGLQDLWPASFHRSCRREEVALSARACQVAVAESIMHDCGTSAAAMTTGRGGALL